MKKYYKTQLKLVIFIIFFSLKGFSQGAWNLKYVILDSLNTSHLGQEIRIDFKANSIDTISHKVTILSIRALLRYQDTIIINLNGKKLKFVESWKLYVDHGAIQEQSLVSIDKKYVLKDMILFLYDQKYIKVKVKVYTFSSKKIIDEIEMTLEKEKIKGLLFKIVK
jgi:hypothetical protein